MKTLNAYLESLLDDDDIFLDPENDKKVIEDWIMKHYTITGRLIISNDFEVSCIGRVSVKDKSITSLTNGMFRWGVISSSFICNECNNLTSLEGAPEEVGRGFDCAYCSNLKSLKGTPKKVGGSFGCSDCPNLKITDSDRKKYNIEN